MNLHTKRCTIDMIYRQSKIERNCFYIKLTFTLNCLKCYTKKESIDITGGIKLSNEAVFI